MGDGEGYSAGRGWKAEQVDNTPGVAGVEEDGLVEHRLWRLAYHCFVFSFLRFRISRNLLVSPSQNIPLGRVHSGGLSFSCARSPDLLLYLVVTRVSCFTFNSGWNSRSSRLICNRIF